MNHQDVRLTSFLGTGWNYLILITAGLLIGTTAISSHLTTENNESLQRLVAGLELAQSTPNPQPGHTGEIFTFPRCDKNGDHSPSLAGIAKFPWCAHSNNNPSR